MLSRAPIKGCRLVACSSRAVVPLARRCPVVAAVAAYFPSNVWPSPLFTSLASVRAAWRRAMATSAFAPRPDIRVVYVTVGTKDDAIKLSRSLVADRLAACVNIVSDVESVYEWEGTVEVSQELLLIIKTSKERMADLIQAVKERHPYDEPEIIALPVQGGSLPYMQWVVANSTPKSNERL